MPYRQAAIALDNAAPPRQHIHTVVRTPNGNEYGHDLLRQRYKQYDHTQSQTPHRLGTRQGLNTTATALGYCCNPSRQERQGPSCLNAFG